MAGVSEPYGSGGVGTDEVPLHQRSGGSWPSNAKYLADVRHDDVSGARKGATDGVSRAEHQHADRRVAQAGTARPVCPDEVPLDRVVVSRVDEDTELIGSDHVPRSTGSAAYP